MTSAQLQSNYESKLEETITHPLVQDLCAGTLSDHSLGVYLIQDLKYCELFMKVILKTAFLCKDYDTMIVFAKQVGFVATDENDYFQTTIDGLCKKDSTLRKYEDLELPEVHQYIRFLEEISGKLSDYSYNELVTYLWTTETVYLQWANRMIETGKVAARLQPKYKEWITLHSGTEFETWVEFLRSQVDLANTKEVEWVFQKTVDLEYGFFSACYSK